MHNPIMTDSESSCNSTCGGDVLRGNSSANSCTDDADLAAVVAAWSGLPGPIKAGILALVRHSTAGANDA
jgi:hypothetical protein